MALAGMARSTEKVQEAPEASVPPNINKYSSPLMLVVVIVEPAPQKPGAGSAEGVTPLMKAARLSRKVISVALLVDEVLVMVNSTVAVSPLPTGSVRKVLVNVGTGWMNSVSEAAAPVTPLPPISAVIVLVVLV